MERTIVQHEETVRHHLRRRDHDHGSNHDQTNTNDNHDTVCKEHKLQRKGSGIFWDRDYDLLHFNHLPEIFKHNPFILDHYRPHLDSWTAFKSIFHLHNETWNIWSHLLGFFVFVYLLVDGIAFLNTTGDFGDRLWFAIHLVCAQVMLISSVTYHTLSCNIGICAHVAKLDYSGISAMITGSIYFPLYYIFHCEPTLFLFYISVISLLGGYSIYFCWRSQKVGDAGFEGLRVALFIGLSIFGLLPLVHGYWLYGAEFMLPIIWRLALMGATYVAGAMIYLHKLPECFFPGKFDLHFNSHVIWHFFVLAAALVHYYNHFFMYEYRTQHNACPAPSFVPSDDLFVTVDTMANYI